MRFIKVTESNQVPPGTMKSFTVGGKTLLLANVGGKFYAIDNKCTHAGGDLSKGVLEGNIVTCPRHHAKFDVATGKNIAGPKIPLVKPKGKGTISYKVKLEGENIQVDLG